MMNAMDRLREDPRSTLFANMTGQRAGMLGVVDSDQHMQPMTHYPDPQTAEVWFITSSQTDLVKAVGTGARAHYCLIAEDGTFYACLSGTLEQVDDEEKLDQLWSPIAAAWFDEGRDDSDVVLLRLTLQEAALWASTDNAAIFGLEIARANISKARKPDVGEHVLIGFEG